MVEGGRCMEDWVWDINYKSSLEVVLFTSLKVHCLEPNTMATVNWKGKVENLLSVFSEKKAK